MPTLPPDCPPLHDRLRADQSERWGRGEYVRVESYLELHPELASNPEALVDLIYAEVLLRLETGEAPILEEYLERFPQAAAPLRQRWQAHDLIAGQARPDNRVSTVSELGTHPVGPARRPARLPSLPGYEILEELGRGGMGVVYKARQVAFDRLVAVKMVRGHLLAGPDEINRFRTEARALGQLDHPHVVRVFDFDEDQGCPFFVMQYLPGGTLATLLREGPLPPRHAAEVVRQVALGVQAAHDKNILHRDLKPFNVLLDERGCVHVADFGLAKLLDEESGQTLSAVVMGTPAYMAPEQAAGKAREVGRAADVWALGVILYECLTGKLPFKGESRAETLEQVKTQQPTPPRQLRAEVPPHLEAICLKCLEKGPKQRPGSAAELADELGCWLQGERPVGSRPARLSNTLRRCLWAGGSAALALTLAAVLLPWLPGRRPADDPSVTLIGESGGPAQSRWRLGRESSTAGVAGPDGLFKVSSRECAFLELQARPPWPNFRLEAQVRHEDNTGVGSVGVGFAYREDGAGIHSGFSRLCFVDRGSRRGMVEVVMHGYQQGPRSSNGSDILRSKYYRPVGPDNGPGLWRQLALEVVGGRARAFWEGTVSARRIGRNGNGLPGRCPGCSAASASPLPSREGWDWSCSRVRRRFARSLFDRCRKAIDCHSGEQ